MNTGTAIYGIVGENISYTLSPLIYRALFSKHHIDAIYNRFDLAAQDLPTFVAAVRTLPLAGFNVTIPHKETIIQYLDQCDIVSKATGASNLVVNRNGRLRGYNTDFAGIAAAIETQMDYSVTGADVLLVGSGGAARTAYYYLVKKRAARVQVLHRSKSRERAFAAWASNLAGKTTYLASTTASTSDLAAADLCINCTPVGLEKLLGRSRAVQMKRVFELRYGTHTGTRRGWISGDYMLAVQAAHNFRIMTGISETPETIMRIMKKATR